VNDAPDRRRNVRLRRRIDELLRRVRGANDEIVERGLAAREHAQEVRRDPEGPPSSAERENGPPAASGTTETRR
jgi:ribosomal protein L14E/L6E/L27E